MAIPSVELKQKRQMFGLLHCYCVVLRRKLGASRRLGSRV